MRKKKDIYFEFCKFLVKFESFTFLIEVVHNAISQDRDFLLCFSEETVMFFVSLTRIWFFRFESIFVDLKIWKVLMECVGWVYGIQQNFWAYKWN